MKELTMNELNTVNGGGLTLVDLLVFTGSLFVAGSSWPVAVAGLLISEYADYKDGK